MSGKVRTINVIDVPYRQDIPGLRFRAFQGEADYVAMADLLNECLDTDTIERVTSAEEIAHNFRYLENCDPCEDMVFVEAYGEVIAYARVSWHQESNGDRIYKPMGCVRPGWRQRGVGSVMMTWAEERLRDIATAHQEDGARFFQTWASTEDTGKLTLLVKAGYDPYIYVAEMLRQHLDDLPEVPMPEGLVVRDVRPRQYRAIYQAANEALRDHWGHVEPSEEGFQRFFADPHIDLSLWRVAWDCNQVAGLVRSSIDYQENEVYDRRRGYIDLVSVRRPWRRRGLARSLLIQSLHGLRSNGMEEASLDVHTENPNGAFRLYESVGFHVNKLFAILRKPMNLG
jgi:ribosomal protein S18 acetylase RimI-like enzyme